MEMCACRNIGITHFIVSKLAQQSVQINIKSEFMYAIPRGCNCLAASDATSFKRLICQRYWNFNPKLHMNIKLAIIQSG